MLRWLKRLFGSAAGGADAQALFRLGESALAQGRSSEAASLLRRAITLDPAVPAFHRTLALACRAQADLAGAKAAYRSALRLEPGDVPTLVKLGTVCTKLGDVADARRSLDDAVRAAPGFAEAHLRRGELFLEESSPARAVEACLQAVRLDPGAARAHVALGWAHEVGGEVDAALAAYETALQIDPTSVDAHVSRATIHLSRENFPAGWDEFEWRRRVPGQAALHERFGAPDWDGSPLEGRTLLFYGEQGLGDQIMYASCLPDLLRQGARCVIDCEPRLVALFERSFPQAVVHGARQSDPGDWIAAHEVEVKLACASAPRFLRRSAADFPAHGGFLRADQAKVEKWQRRLAQIGPQAKVGLSWRGGVQRTGRAWRSLEVESLLPVLRYAGVQFISLQYDAHPDELARLREKHGVTIHHWPEAIEDYDETAALLCALDLTISVCTAVIHLAGALGRPVWILAPVKPDARYGLQGSSMRWYPSARLYRQRSFGDWAGVLEEIRADLSRGWQA